MRALVGVVPFGAVIYDVAEGTAQRLREEDQDESIQQLIADTAQADPAHLRSEIDSVVQEVAHDAPPEVQKQLATYLAVVPAAIRQSLRRPSDPSGKSLPLQFAVDTPERLATVLPVSLPRFKPGDRPSCLSGAGDWQLEELLGVGGFGEVWKARHVFFDAIAPVAVKFCLDANSRERLLKHEASVLNQVMRQGRHPGIVPLLDASLMSDPPFLKYEFIEGGDLAGWIRENPKENAKRATLLLLQLARIVAFAHRANPPIVHRDLKPANVLVVRLTNEEHEVRVTDFGIGAMVASKAIHEANQGTQSATHAAVLGTLLRGSHTPIYASPQQMRGERADPRDDVHALGIIWYQMLLGDLTATPTGPWTEELEELKIPKDWVLLLGSCVAPKAERRPEDASALVEQLEKLVQPTINKPTPARTPITAAPAVDLRNEDRLCRFFRLGQLGTLAGWLDLSNQGIGDEGCRRLAQSPHLAKLTTLILSGCNIGDEGLAALMASPNVANLERLDLWNNRIGDEGVQALAQCPWLTKLNTLDLGKNNIADAGIVSLAQAPALRQLRDLMFVSNQIGDAGAIAIANSEVLSTLAWLKALENRIGPIGVDALKKTFGKRVRVM
jgi:serine/threonine protein kinase